MGDFNKNILNYGLDKDTTDFVDTMLALSYHSATNTTTRITAT